MNHKNRDWLYQKYVIENLSGPDIAKLCGISKRTIAQYIIKFNICKLYHDKAWLTKQYESGLSTTEIAKLANTNSSVITRNLKKFNIKARSISLGNTARWRDDSYRFKLLAKLRSDEHRKKLRAIWTDEYREAQSAAQAKVWEDEAYRIHQSEIQRQIWANPTYRQKMAAIMNNESWKLKNAQARANMPRVSAIQRILYSLLDDLGITYYREYEDRPADKECIIGPWTFDCVVPRANKPTLLIECQGDYFHNLPAERARDKSKATYISSMPNYELKYIWEHEFKNHNKIIELLKYWLGISAIEVAKFDFSDILIKECPASDYRILLAKYHYLANAGRGGIAYGAYLNKDLIAVCVFSPLVRQNIIIDGYKNSESCELSRLCIHPRYQIPNLASWFISRCLKLLGSKYKCIISYCDRTFNHDGAVYKACNFIQDGVVPADYWYISKDGWKIHKKTLYGHAIKMGMKESEYVQKMGYTKLYGSIKLRFKYIR